MYQTLFSFFANQSIAQYRKQFEETYQEVLEKTQRDIRRLNAKIKNFSNFSDYEAVEEYVKVLFRMLPYK